MENRYSVGEFAFVPYDSEKSSFFVRSTPPEFKEPFEDDPEYLPAGSMPMNQFISTTQKERQAAIASGINTLFLRPPGFISHDFAEMLEEDHVIGEQRRSMKNYESYCEWLTLGEEVGSEELRAIIDRCIIGVARPLEIIDFALATNLQSFEVGKLTHPYGYRMKHLESFRKEVNEAITSRNGILYPTVIPYRSITITPKVIYNQDGTHDLVGAIAKYKRDIGRIEMDGQQINIVERQLAGIRTDEESGFRRDIIEKMKRVDINVIRPWETKREQYLMDTGFKGFIEKAIQLDSIDDFIVPDSTMIYGYKSKPETELRKRIVAKIPEFIGDMPFFDGSHAHFQEVDAKE